MCPTTLFSHFEYHLKIVLTKTRACDSKKNPRFGDEWVALVIISLMAFFYAVANMLSRLLKDIEGF